METCPYCGLELNERYCSFCKMEIAAEDVQHDGFRKPLTPDPFVVSAYAELSTPELMQKSTYYLIYLLREVRKERTGRFSSLRIFNKFEDTEYAEQFGEIAEETGQSYEWWTRKAWVIENILRDRMDHFPTRITDRYMIELAENMDQSSKKPMKLSREKRQRKPF